uniref:AMPK1_CBM domain-containing protein n=1 Tax=Angiostrongylus cantonensis TaxID=6313 RepID=A0A158PBX2_ANGCA
LHNVTETSMFNPVTIMAILITTFCVFYFIDFITQMFSGVTSAIGLPSASMSQTFIEPIVPRTRKRRKGMHSKESCTQDSSSISRADSTQANTSSTVDTAVPMKDMLTRSIRPGSGTHAPPESSQKPAAATTQLKPVSAADMSSDRNLAGRSPRTAEQMLETRKAGPMLSKNTQASSCQSLSKQGIQISECKFNSIYRTSQLSVSFLFTEPVSLFAGIWMSNLAFLSYDLMHLTLTSATRDVNRDYCDTTGVQFLCYDQLDEVYLEYTAKLDEVRTEFSIDDVSDPDKLLDEWENSDAVGMSPDVPTMTSSEEDFTESIYGKALNVFNRIIAKSGSQAQENISNTQEGRTEKGPGNLECIMKTAEMEKLLSSSEESQNKLHKGDIRPEQNDNLLRVPRFLDSEIQVQCDVEDTEVFLTGSFFGWKMSLPMQRERNAFRLKITLPAGEHQYRFEVHRHPTGSTSDVPYIVQE